MMDPQRVFEIGKRNYQAMRRILWKCALLVHAEAIGGDQSRSVRLENSTGRLLLHEGGEQRELTSSTPQKGGTSWRTAS
jgi:chemotaxis protein CheD